MDAFEVVSAFLWFHAWVVTVHWSSATAAMSKPRPVGCMVPSVGFCYSKSIYILATCPYFDNLEFQDFDAGGPQCHFITSVAITVRIQTLSVY